MVAFILGRDSITFTVKGRPFNVSSTHLNFKKIKEELKKPNPSEQLLVALVDTKEAIKKYSGGHVHVDGDNVYYDGEVLRGCMVERLLDMLSEGFNISPLVKFIENLMQNPSKKAVDTTYMFLEKHGFPLTEDGCFLGYKGVGIDNLDIFSRKIVNKPGVPIQRIPRRSVDDDSKNICSYGYHVGTFGYANSYKGAGKLLLVKVNPMDVVSVPEDARADKIRVCWYEVMEEYMDDKPMTESVRRYDAYEDNDYYDDVEEEDDEPHSCCSQRRDSRGRFA